MAAQLTATNLPFRRLTSCTAFCYQLLSYTCFALNYDGSMSDGATSDISFLRRIAASELPTNFEYIADIQYTANLGNSYGHA